MKLFTIFAAAAISSSAFAQSFSLEDCDKKVLGSAGQEQCVSAVKALRDSGKEVNDAAIAEIMLKSSPEPRAFGHACIFKLMYRNGQHANRVQEEKDCVSYLNLLDN